MSTPTIPISPPPRSAHKHWLLGDIPELRRDMMQWMEIRHEELGPIFSASLLRRKLVITNEPDHIRYVLQENNRNYRKSFGYDVLKLFLGEGLLTSEGDFWLRQRRLAQPAFHRKRLEALSVAMIEESELWSKRWAGVDSGDSVDVLDDMMAVTMRIVARALFSSNVDEHIPTISYHMALLNDFAMDRIKTPFPTPIWIPTQRQRAYKRANEELDRILYGMIEARRGHTADYDDLLSMLMEAQDADTGDQMTDLQLRDECMTIFVAGHETTAITMAWTFDLLSRNPQVQERLREELQSVLGERAPVLDDLKNLRYTRAVIDEALRLYPPGWVIGRLSLGPDEIGGYAIEENTNILLTAYSTQRRSDLWDRPEDFWPERWETERVKDMPRYAYFPFGGGPRLCIGNNFALMEMTFLLASLARGRRFVAESDQPVAMDPLITLRPGSPIRIRMERV